MFCHVYYTSHESLKFINESEYRLNTKYKNCYAFILFFFYTTVRILFKWYVNELLGYLIMSFTSIPVTANDKNKSECMNVFFFY